MKVEQKDIRWPFVLWWVLASFGGWVIFTYLFFVAVAPLRLYLGLDPQDINVLSGASIGVLMGTLLGIPVGLFQWLALREYLPRASRWLVATLFGLSLGTAMGMVTLVPAITDPGLYYGSFWRFALPATLLPGIMVGLTQHLILQRHFKDAWWWLVPSALSWPVLFFVVLVGYIGGDASIGLLIFLPLAGLIAGLISGMSLFFVLKSRREMESPPGHEQVSQRRVKMRGLFSILVHGGIVALLLAWVSAVYIPLTHELSARKPILTLTGHTGVITNLAFSPDGTLLASGSTGGTVSVWRTDSGELLHTLEHIGGVESVSFSPDGKTLASGSKGDIKLWHLADGTLLRTLPEGGNNIAFSPDGLKLASVRISVVPFPGESQATLTLWQVADGKALWTQEAGTVRSYPRPSLFFSPNGAILVGGFEGSDDGIACLWLVESGALLHTLTFTHSGETRLAFSPDGKTLVAGSQPGNTSLWEVGDGDVLTEVARNRPSAGTDPTASSTDLIAFSTDRSVMVSVSIYGPFYTVWFWHTADRELLQTQLKGEGDSHIAYPSVAPPPDTGLRRSITFSPDLKMMATVDPSGIIRIYEIEAPPEVSVPATRTNSPALVSPGEGAVLDNGRMDSQDDVAWDFDWYDYEGATEYNLSIQPPESPGAPRPPLTFTRIVGSSFHWARRGYISNCFGWTWKVRAKVDGEWTEWSETRAFDVEPVNTDPPRYTRQVW
jgi:WD40 repeat protein